jgi:AraC-like DNA-binding protein
MNASLIQNPLAKFSLFRTSDIDDGHLKIANSVSPHKVCIVNDQRLLDINFTGLHINTMPLVGVYYGAEVEVSPEQSEYYFAQTTLTGTGVVRHGTEEYATAAGNTAIVSPSVPYNMRLSAGCQRVAIGINPTELCAYLSKLINDEVNQELVFDLKFSNEVAWWNTINYITKQICDSPHVIECQSIQKVYSDLVMSSLLELHNHNYISKINAKEDSMLCPQIKSAVDYIHDNIKEVITAADLAEYSKVSLRTLQRNFLKYMDMPPTKFIRDAKLNAIHEELKFMQVKEAGAIKRILLEYNVYDFGRFANYYRSKFGTTPKNTLLKA